MGFLGHLVETKQATLYKIVGELPSRLYLSEPQRLQILFEQDLAWGNRRPEPVRVSSDRLRRGLRRHCRSLTGT